MEDGVTVPKDPAVVLIETALAEAEQKMADHEHHVIYHKANAASLAPTVASLKAALKRLQDV
jgi:hypothetical protein